jgi:hypothetical protein
MTAQEFRRLALALPEAVERSHMNHPDFRVRGRIFATLSYPNTDSGVVMLRPDQQADFVEAEPGIFVPVKGAWGRRGATTVRLTDASRKSVRIALEAAWARVAPKTLVAQHAGHAPRKR